MPTNTTVSWFKYDLRQKRTTNCGTAYDYVVPTDQSATVVTDAIKESRPFPPSDKPSWYYGTSQPVQVTHALQHGVYSRFVSSWGDCDNDGYTDSVYTYSEHVYYTTNQPIITVPFLPYETKLRLKIKDRAVNLGTSLVEYRQTLGMFSHLAGVVSQVYRDLRRGRVPRHLRLPSRREAAENWLMYSYGIKPLVSDAVASLNQLQNRLVGDIWDSVYLKLDNKHDYEDELYGSTTLTGHYYATRRVKAYFKVIPKPADFLLGNAAELAWEVIPFSFVIDWVLNVGDTLSALDALDNVIFERAFVTDKLNWSWHQNITGVISGTVISSPANQYKSHVRNSVSSLGLDPIRYEPSTSYYTLANAIALLTVLTSR